MPKMDFSSLKDNWPLLVVALMMGGGSGFGVSSVAEQGHEKNYEARIAVLEYQVGLLMAERRPFSAPLSLEIPDGLAPDEE